MLENKAKAIEGWAFECQPEDNDLIWFSSVYGNLNGDIYRDKGIAKQQGCQCDKQSCKPVKVRVTVEAI